MRREAMQAPTLTGEGARSAAVRRGTESGASTANEELAQDAAFYVSFRGRTDTGEEYVPCAYR